MEADEVGIFINDNGYDNHDNYYYEKMLSETFREAHDLIKEKPIINRQKEYLSLQVFFFYILGNMLINIINNLYLLRESFYK